MIQITSRNNKTVCECAKLKEKKFRDNSSLFVFEGKKLFLEAVLCGVKLEKIFVTEKGASLIKDTHTDAEVYLVTDSVYEKLSDDSSPDGIFCVAKKDLHRNRVVIDNSEYVPANNAHSLFMTVSVRDPGNLGTVLRTASALGIDTILLSGDCVDVYNPKTIRSAMGAVFKQKTVCFRDTVGMIEHLKQTGFAVYAAALTDSAMVLGTFDLPSRHCFVAGNEGHGLDEKVINACTSAVIIPMMPNNESLNVASASSILMWESNRAKLSKEQ